MIHYVAICPSCNQNKKATAYERVPKQESNSVWKGAHAKILSGCPNGKVHLDFLGSLPRSPTGNEYVMMMVDQFTKTNRLNALFVLVHLLESYFQRRLLWNVVTVCFAAIKLVIVLAWFL